MSKNLEGENQKEQKQAVKEVSTNNTRIQIKLESSALIKYPDESSLVGNADPKSTWLEFLRQFGIYNITPKPELYIFNRRKHLLAHLNEPIHNMSQHFINTRKFSIEIVAIKQTF